VGPYRYLGPSGSGVGHERGATILESLATPEANSRGMTTRAPPPGDDDPNAFRRAMAGVRPLPERAATPARPRPRAVARFARAEGRDLLLENHAVAASPAVQVAGDELTFRRAFVRDQVMRKLQRGRFALEAEIDLHGLRQHAAHEALRQFLNDCVHRGLQCVRVIHGKGLRSGAAGPVLKLAVHQWLRKVENVAAFVAARPADGGSGAVYVLLTGRK
jgi:DNA-nicking Smr family endonuclease